MQPSAHAASALFSGLAWGVPFAGLLLSVALLPLAAPRFWHRRAPLVTLGWTLALLLPLAWAQGAAAAGHLLLDAALLEYLPFLALLLALYVAGGGILIEGGPWGTPGGNTALLALGTLLAGVMGTTGVSMVLIHPLLRANQHRRRKVHLVVFFILLAANAGGATTPLGDPPLYLGFLNGVPFAWPLLHLSLPLLVLAGPLLAVFWVLDARFAAADPAPGPRQRLRLRGWPNVALLGAVVATVLAQGVWRPGVLDIGGVAVAGERLLGMVVFAAATLLSLRITPRSVREGNLFTWEPMREVAVLFAGIFVTIAPVLALLAGAVASGSGLPPGGYFWTAGVLSAFLDNAPTYLIFFRMAGQGGIPADAALAAISAGAVFFGALTYIGNAPNLMVRGIAAHRGIRMPGFFGYMAWSCALLLPLFALQWLIFFR